MAGVYEGSAPRIPLDQQAAAVIREIGMRERVYPAWVRSGRMKQDKADHEIAAMRAVLVTVNEARAAKGLKASHEAKVQAHATRT